MVNVVGIRIKGSGKLFLFQNDDKELKIGDIVLTELDGDIKLGEIRTETYSIDGKETEQKIGSILRIASNQDLEHQKENDEFAKKAFILCKEKISENKLDMKLVKVEPMFDNSKIMFYFTANQRIDFRQLVKDLASVFHTRIELRQIGVRDEAKIVGSLGPCGRPICCGKFLGDFQPVSIKMAKEQNLSLNPTKISGICGRLMCCLKYEQDFYEETRKIMPKLGKRIDTPEGSGIVKDVNIIKETVTVRIDNGDSSDIFTFTKDELKLDKIPNEKNNDCNKIEPIKKDSRNTNIKAPNISKKPKKKTEVDSKKIEQGYKANTNRRNRAKRKDNENLKIPNKNIIGEKKLQKVNMVDNKQTNWQKALNEALKKK